MKRRLKLFDLFIIFNIYRLQPMIDMSGKLFIVACLSCKI